MFEASVDQNLPRQESKIMAASRHAGHTSSQPRAARIGYEAASPFRIAKRQRIFAEQDFL